MKRETVLRCCQPSWFGAAAVVVVVFLEEPAWFEQLRGILEYRDHLCLGPFLLWWVRRIRPTVEVFEEPRPGVHVVVVLEMQLMGFTCDSARFGD